MNPRVMLVDDETRVLQGLERNLRRDFDLRLHESPEQALEMLKTDRRFAVIVSDMRMPGMNGVQFLAAARKLAPDSVRVMLTGNTDQDTAMRAVNDGEVFKFLLKPCEPERLREVLDAAVQQYRYALAERELLERTLKGSITMLSEVLAIAQPEVFGRAARLRQMVMALAESFPEVPRWQIDTAAQLSQIGCLHVPTEIVTKVHEGDELTADEQRKFYAHAQLGADLLRNIPRLGPVADIVMYQHKAYDGSGFPALGATGDEIPLGARILHVALAHDALRAQGWTDASIMVQLTRDARRYDPHVLAALAKHVDRQNGERRLRVLPHELRDGMVLLEDVCTSAGKLLVCRGHDVTAQVRRFLARFHDEGRLSVHPVLVVDAPTRDAAA